MAIIEADCQGNMEKIKQLANECNIITLNEALCVACEQGDLHIVEWMTSNTDVAVNYVGREFTPLSAACSRTQLNVAQY